LLYLVFVGTNFTNAHCGNYLLNGYDVVPVAMMYFHDLFMFYVDCYRLGFVVTIIGFIIDIY
jgi:hypothetical protein